MEGGMLIKILVESLTGATLSYRSAFDNIIYLLEVDWGDGTINYETTNTYTTIGEYQVRLRGYTKSIKFYLSTDYPLIFEIVQWGLGATNYIDAFEGSNIIAFPPDRLVAENTSHMFVNSFRLNTLPNIDTSNVTDMSHMFAGCKQFNQSLGSYSIQSISNGTSASLSVNLKDILYFTNISTDNYSDTLIKWANKPIIPQYIDLGTVSTQDGKCTYNSSAKDSHDKLVNDYHWKIVDGGIIYPPMIINIETLAGSTLSYISEDKLKVNWGDGTINYETTHTYTSATYYTVTFTGYTKSIKFYLSTDNPFINEIVQWGLGATNYIDAFEGSNINAFPSERLVAENTSHMFVNSFRLNTLPTIDTSNVTDMSHMFAGCKQFNQSLGSYSIQSISNGTSASLSVNLKDILYFTNISTDNYSDTLIKWADQPVIPHYIDLGEVTNYLRNRIPHTTEANAAYDKLTKDYHWNIVDGNTPKSSLPSPPMILTIDLMGPITVYPVSISINGEIGENITIDWGDNDDPSTIYWGDYTIDSNPTHTYTTGMLYTITISGKATQFNYSANLNAVLTEVVQWGLGITDYSGAFQECNKNIILPSTPLTGVTNTSYMFSSSNFNRSLHIDTSSVVNMSYMFYGCSSFNTPIVFNTPLVNKMEYMFAFCPKFNQSVTLNTSNVHNMSYMFYGCSSFNQLIEFDTSSVSNMSFMFYNTLVNQSFASFSIANILSGTDTTLYPGLLNIFKSTNLNRDTYSDTLIGWANQDTIPSYVNLGIVSDSSEVIPHTIQAHASYLKLVHEYNWNISDGGLVYDTSTGGVTLNNYQNLKKYALLAYSGISTRSSTIKNGFYGSMISSYIGQFIGRNDSVNPYIALVELIALIQSIVIHYGNPDNLGIITASQTLYPNINYNSATSIIFEGVPIILDAQGNPNARFFIKAHSELVFNNIPSITLINGASPYNIYWLAGTTISFTGTLPPIIPGIFIAGSGIIVGDSTTYIRMSILENIEAQIIGHLFSLGNIVLSDISVEASYLETIVCYLKGTFILTNQGYVPIETIKAGHKVVTKGKIHENKFVNKNAPLKIEPVMWISKFKVFDLTTKSRPICVSKDAFGKNYPFKDLYVSPSHQFLIHGKMVIASKLINGKTIWQDAICDDVVYYHLECEEHSAIIANGVLTETCLSTNKDMFEHSIQYYHNMNSPKMNFKKISLGMY
jgi:hypothetical protein